MRSTIRTPGERAMVRQLAAYVAGSLGQGVPFVVIAVEFTRRDTPDAWLASVAMAHIIPYGVCSPQAGVVAGGYRLGRVVTASAVVRLGLTLLILSFLHSVPAAAAVSLLMLIGVAGTPSSPALMPGLRDTVAEPQREPWGRHIVPLDSLMIAAIVAGGLAGPLPAIVTGTRESLAVLAVAATIWTLWSPWGLLVHRPALPAGTPLDLRRAVMEGAAR